MVGLEMRLQLFSMEIRLQLHPTAYQYMYVHPTHIANHSVSNRSHAQYKHR